MSLASDTFLLAIMVTVACGVDTSDGTGDCGPTYALLDRVVDGDTAYTAEGDAVRYLLLDAPEVAHQPGVPSDCYAVEAAAENRALSEGREVRLEYDRECRDHYGRLLAYVWHGESLVNELLLAGGAGRLLVIAPNDRYAREMRRAEDDARSRGAGLWGRCE